MREELQRSTQVVSYLLWEYTRHENALDLWYCAEDIAFYAERCNLIDDSAIAAFLRKRKYDYEYIEFIRNIAYRLFVYTGNSMARQNWYLAEHMLENKEWIRELANMASIYRKVRNCQLEYSIIKSTNIRNYYKNESSKNLQS